MSLLPFVLWAQLAPSPVSQAPSPPALSSSPPPAPAPAYPASAPGDIYPRTERERKLCRDAGHPDWWYLLGMAAVDVAAGYYGSISAVKWRNTGQDVGDLAVRLGAPASVGLAWGITVGGVWLAMPKCSPEWVGETPQEGTVRENWPLALSIAIAAGVTAPVVNGIVVGYTLPQAWTTEERAAHLVVAGLFGFGGALLPYVLPPRTVRASREIDKIRFGTDGRSVFLGYTATF